jgi:hypothetical protein
MTNSGFIPISLDTGLSSVQRKQKQRRLGHLKAKQYKI